MRHGWLHLAWELQPLVWATLTESYWERARGLLGRPTPAPGTGMVISPCGSVHTFGMSYAIDVVFLNRDWRVLGVTEALKPWRLAMCLQAAHVLELAPGEARRIGIAQDMKLQWTEDR